MDVLIKHQLEKTYKRCKRKIENCRASVNRDNINFKF